jgi:plastocyanin
VTNWIRYLSKVEKELHIMVIRKWFVRITVPILFLAAIVAVHRIMAARPAEASNVEVKIDNFSFSPASLTVRVGTQITWMNRDDIPHTIVEDSRAFKSKVLDTDEKYTFTLSQPGTYKYYCSIHPRMTGKLVVE